MAPELEHELHRKIVENPDDEGLRQVYADLLAERGDERAAFIRLQCELEGLPRGDRRTQLEQAEREILSRRHAEWVGAARLAPGQLKFVRGFAEAWTCTPRDFIDLASVVVGAAPLRKVTLFPSRWSASLNEALARPEAQRLRVLELHGVDWDWSNVPLSMDLPRLERLELLGHPRDPPPAPAGIRLPALQSLELRIPLSPELVRGFATAAPRVVFGAGHALDPAALERLRATFGGRLTVESW